MKRFTLTISLSLTACLGFLLAGCEKKAVEVRCYECAMTYESGIPAGTQYPCLEDISQWQKGQTDNNGRPIASVCKEK